MKPLKDLFLEAIEKHITIYKGSDEQAAAERCEAILKEKAIEFSEWIEAHGYQRSGWRHEPLRWTEFKSILTDNPPTFTTSDLFDLFLKENK